MSLNLDELKFQFILLFSSLKASKKPQQLKGVRRRIKIINKFDKILKEEDELLKKKFENKDEDLINNVGKVCDRRINDFMQGNINIEKLGHCYQKNDDLKINKSISPYDGNDCILVSKKCKRDKYYIHTYDPIQTLNEMYKEVIQTGSEFENFKAQINKLFVLQKRDNCCNCVSISLYSPKRKENLTTLLETYLYSIERSIKNVQKCLPDWIVRLYLDTSVYRHLKYNLLEKEITSILNWIFEQPNVEVYTYFCEEAINDEIPISFTRTYRYSPLYDEEVNICAVREADGTVTYMDCYNLKVFSQTNRILHLIDLKGVDYNHMRYHWFPEISSMGVTILSYSDWLRLFKDLWEKTDFLPGDWTKYYSEICGDFFKKKTNLFDILAGIFVTKFKLKREIYMKTAFMLKKMIYSMGYYLTETGLKFVISKLGGDEEKFINQYLKDDKWIKNQSRIKGIGIDFITDLIYFTIGFDEILLLCIYKEIISAKFNLIDKKNHIVKFDPVSISYAEIAFVILGNENSVKFSEFHFNSYFVEYNKREVEYIKKLLLNNFFYMINYEKEEENRLEQHVKEFLKKLLTQDHLEKYYLSYYFDSFFSPENTNSFKKNNLFIKSNEISLLSNSPYAKEVTIGSGDLTKRKTGKLKDIIKIKETKDWIYDKSFIISKVIPYKIYL